MFSKVGAVMLCLTAGASAKAMHVGHDHVIGARATPTGDASPAGPTHAGAPTNCNEWYTVQDGDDCSVPEGAFGITHAQFIEWNLAVSEDCIFNFWPTYSYCVGVGEVLTTTTPTSTASATTTGMPGTTSGNSTLTTSMTTTPNATYSTRNPVTDWNITTTSVDRNWPPSQTKAGQPSYCNNWHLVKSGETCDTVVRLYASSIDMEDL